MVQLFANILIHVSVLFAYSKLYLKEKKTKYKILHMHFQTDNIFSL